MNDAPAAGPGARLLEVRIVEIVSGPGRSVTLSSVRCPVRGGASAVEACADCGEGEGIARDALSRGEFLCCGGPREARAPAAATARVGDAMARAAVALRPGVERDAASDALRAHAVSAAPVVDGDGRPIGAVSEVDLLRAAPGAKVADAMTRVALAVTEGAALDRALALMAGHRVDRLAVVGGDGVLVGVLGAGDVIAWLAAA